MNNLGFLYANGYGVPQSYKMAMQWYLKSAEYGNETAMENVALFYSNGNAGEVSEQKALDWRLKAAEAGHSVSEEEQQADK